MNEPGDDAAGGVGGALHDRHGGPWTARLMMLCTSALGLPALVAAAMHRAVDVPER